MLYDMQIEKEPVEVVEWLSTLIISIIPVFGQGMLLFWSFNKDVDKNKSNFAKACLLFQAGAVILWVLFFRVLFSA